MSRGERPSQEFGVTHLNNPLEKSVAVPGDCRNPQHILPLRERAAASHAFLPSVR